MRFKVRAWSFSVHYVLKAPICLYLHCKAKQRDQNLREEGRTGRHKGKLEHVVQRVESKKPVGHIRSRSTDTGRKVFKGVCSFSHESNCGVMVCLWLHYEVWGVISFPAFQLEALHVCVRGISRQYVRSVTVHQLQHLCVWTGPLFPSSI